MTADGTITPQVGGTITERSALNALPAGTVLRDTLTGCVLTILADDHDQPAGIEAVAGSSSWSLSHGLTVLHRPDAPQPGTTGDDMVTRAEAERMVAEQSEMDLAMHKAYRPEVVAEVAVHLSEETDWDAVAKWCGGTIRTGQEPSGEYVSDMHIPGVGTAWQGAWIVQRHDRTFAIRAEVEGPSAESVAALAAARAGGAEPSPLCDCGEPKDGHSHPRTGEAVDREALGREVRTAVSLWDNDGDVRGRPDEVWAAIDREAAYITRHLLDTVLAARGDAAPTVTAERLAALVEQHGPVGHAWYRQGSGVVPMVWLHRLIADLGIEVTP